MRAEDAAKIVAMIAARWSVPAMSDETQELWAELIEDLEADQVQRVVMDLMRARTERPDLAEIRKLVAAEGATEATGAEQFLEPEEAWGVVVAAFSKVGRYREFPPTYPLVAEAVERIGWQTLCGSDNQEADRAHFMRIYGEILRRAESDSAATFGARPVMPSGSGLSRIERAGGLARIGEVALSALGFRKAEGAP